MYCLRSTWLVFWLLFFQSIGISVVAAQTPRSVALEPTAAIQLSPPKITLQWKATSSAGGTPYQSLAKRLWSEGNSGASVEDKFVSLPSITVEETEYADTNILPGTLYEYLISRNGTNVVVPAGLEIPWTEKRGGVLIIVDHSLASSLQVELNALEQDLRLDGYVVATIQLPRSVVAPETANVGSARRAEIDSVRNSIKVWHLSNTSENRSVILIGHLPVPYSGLSAADGHTDHSGAWSTDLFYSALEDHDPTTLASTWTDTSSSFTSVQARTLNVAGDGKLDQNFVRPPPLIKVGRIDFSRLSFGPELELLKRYLVRNHAYRQRSGGFVELLPRTVVDDNFGYFSGESFATTAWNASSIINGGDSGVASDWFNTTLPSPHWLTYGCGGGSYTSCGGVGSSSTFQTAPTKSPFFMLFGSYFGDWDNPNNLMLTALAGSADSLGLAVIWANRPTVDLSPLAVGAPVGVIALRKNSNNGSLLGDPTLRMQHIAPPASINGKRSANGVEISWEATPTANIVGYHVFAATDSTGPYTRLTGVAVTKTAPAGQPILATNYTDATPLRHAHKYFYVVAIKRINTGTVSYYDSSQGTYLFLPALPFPREPEALRVIE